MNSNTKNKIGIVKKVLILNKDYNNLTRSDLQGLTLGIALRTIPDDKNLQMEVNNKLLQVLDTTAGCTSTSCEEYIKSEVGMLKEQLRNIGYTVL